MFGRLRSFQQTGVYTCRCLCHGAADGVRVRFAPSPTGEIHLGGLRTALYNYLFAKSKSGTFILRIEDTDQTRLREGAQERLIDMLKWTGIEIDEGPNNPGQYGPYVQSQRVELYQKMVKVLMERKAAYRCFCSERRLEMLKKEAVLRGETPRYDNNCRFLSATEIENKLKSNTPYVYRFKLEDFTETWPDLVYGPISYNTATIEGDPIILKSDGFPTYHFANVVDDHFMKITHVLRGQEWLVSTTKHILLYRAFDWQPPQFAHLPLLLGKGNKKLSKRHGDFSIQHFKDRTYFPETVLNLLTENGSGFKSKNIVGMTMKELIENFDLDLMFRHSSHLNLDRADDINREHMIRKLNDTRQTDLIVQQFLELYRKRRAEKSLSMEEPSKSYVVHILHQMKNRIYKIEDLLRDEYEYLWSAPDVIRLPQSIDKTTAAKVIQKVMEVFEKDNDLAEKAVAQDIRLMCDANGLVYSVCMKVLRICLTSAQTGPSIGEIVATLGRDITLERLSRALNQISKNS